MRKEKVRVFAFLMVLIMVIISLDIPVSAGWIGNGEIALEKNQETETTDSAEMEDALAETIGETIGESMDELQEMEAIEEENLTEEETQDVIDIILEDAERHITECEENFVVENTLLSDSDAIVGGTVETICADGTIGSITWNIDNEGLLTIEGSGTVTSTEGSSDWLRWPWTGYFSKIKTAKVSLKNFDSAQNLFRSLECLESIDLTNMDTTNVTDMRWMFSSCSSLESLDLSCFDTGKVTYMNSMFSYSEKLTEINLKNWDTSKVTNMECMFKGCTSLKILDITSFNTSQVTDMSEMFWGCENLTSLDLSRFNTNKVSDMNNMFCLCYKLTNLDIANFNTSQVQDMQSMFCACKDLTSLDVSNFDTTNVTNMKSMFGLCNNLTGLDLSNWNTSSVTDMSGMFSNCENLVNLDISNFNTENVTSMNNMFYDCNLKNLTLGELNTSQVTDMSYMFYYCKNLEEVNLSSFNTSRVTDMNNMFRNCTSLKKLDLSSFNTAQVTDMRRMFMNCNTLETLDISRLTTSKVTNLSEMFSGCSSLSSLDVSKFDTSQVQNMSAMFSECSSLSSLDVSKFDTSQAQNMSVMFSGCSGLSSLNVSGFDTSQVKDMGFMFHDCSGLSSLDVSRFDTSQVQNLEMMFSGCSGLSNLDVSGFDTSRAQNTRYMFENCSGLSSLDVSGFDTSKVTNMDSMFQSCNSLKSLDVTSFDTSMVDWMCSMFSGCKRLESLDLSNFDAVNATRLDSMIGSCINLKRIKSPKNISSRVELPVDSEQSWFDESNNRISELPRNLAVSTTLIRSDYDPAEESETQEINFGLSLYKRLLNLKPQELYTINYHMNIPADTDGTVIWKSSDDNIVTVDNKGNVTAVATGSAIITASVENGLYSDICEVNVFSDSPSELPDKEPSDSETNDIQYVEVNLDITKSDIDTKSEAEINQIVSLAVNDKVVSEISNKLFYTGKKQTINIAFVFDNVRLAEGTDFTIKYKNNINAGTNAQIHIKFIGDYKKIGTIISYFTICPINIISDDLTGINLFYEKGKTVKPVPVLYYNGKKLRAGKDFTYDSTKISADKTLTLKGTGNFSGSRDIKVVFIDKTTETRTPLAKAKVTINKKLVYIGTAVEPTGADFVVTIGSGKNKIVLQQGVDYNVEFSNNNKPGIAAAVIRSIDNSKNCYGEKAVTFKLAGTKLTKADVTATVGSTIVGMKKGMEATCTGSAIIPNVTVKITDANGKVVELKEGSDYTLSYKKNRKKGTASVVITGTDAYTGLKIIKFKIK